MYLLYIYPEYIYLIDASFCVVVGDKTLMLTWVVGVVCVGGAVVDYRKGLMICSLATSLMKSWSHAWGT